ncbi:MAG TPA: kelch repeat-containing protein, partial [Acidobacteriaceae bacterium]|nr:kelch repeat-containing protein [Acidobacteriaceae bacterium]
MPTILTLTIALLASGCGGSSGSSSGSGGTTPPSTPSTAHEWTWESGSSAMILTAGGFYGQPGIYGTQGVASTSNAPGGRAGAVSWTDGSGNLWLFGGNGYDSTNSGSLLLNDLWEFSPTTKEWTWVSGSNTGTSDNSAHGTPGVYGTLGVASATNVPGERDAPVSWTDSSGNLWLFGGAGYDSTGTQGGLND